MLCCAAALWMVRSADAATDSGASMEYKLKAAFLFNLAKFTQWPEENSTGPFVIGIVGDDPFGSSLEVFHDRQVVGRPIEVRYLEPEDDLLVCQIVFIAPSAMPRSAEILAVVEGAPVLTVGDVDGFATSGGMINLLLVEEKIRLEVNVDRSLAAGLQISVRLLNLGTIVRDD